MRSEIFAAFTRNAKAQLGALPNQHYRQIVSYTLRSDVGIVPRSERHVERQASVS